MIGAEHRETRDLLRSRLQLVTRAVRAGERAEVREHRAAVALELRLARGRAFRVERVDDE
jgi:hypothetical protein